eukprot:2460150-Pyramimonas_sp.AAC.1
MYCAGLYLRGRGGGSVGGGVGEGHPPPLAELVVPQDQWGAALLPRGRAHQRRHEQHGQEHHHRQPHHLRQLGGTAPDGVRARCQQRPRLRQRSHGHADPCRDTNRPLRSYQAISSLESSILPPTLKTYLKLN